MAVHIQMSDEAELQMHRDRKRNKVASILSCLLLLTLGGGILYFVVAYAQVLAPAEFTIHTPVDEDKPPVQRPVTNELSSSPSSSSNVAPKVIVSSAVSPVNMARVDIAIDSPIGISSDFGIGTGLGGLGDGLGSGGNGFGTGQGGGSALEGTFYDLKQTRSGASSGIQFVANSSHPYGGMIADGHNGKVVQILHEFISKNWNPAVLNKYYKAPGALYASSFFLPSCDARYAMIAFNCKDKVKPGAWAAIYKGKVRAPKTGKFRFVGAADDLVAVRFASKTVLEAGYAIPTLYNPQAPVFAALAGMNDAYKTAIRNGTEKNHPGYAYIQQPETPTWNADQGGLTAGTTFDVKEGQVYPIEILISEVPGGQFGFLLLIEDMDEKVMDGGRQVLEVFRTGFSMPDRGELDKILTEAKCKIPGELQWPKFNEDSLIWVTVP